MKQETINSNSIAIQQEGQIIFTKPSLSQADRRFCQCLGISVDGLDLFGQKLAVRRLRRAIEESTKSDNELDAAPLKAAFLVKFVVGHVPSVSEISVNEAVSLLASRMQAATDESGQMLFVCSLDTTPERFKEAVSDKLSEL